MTPRGSELLNRTRASQAVVLLWIGGLGAFFALWYLFTDPARVPEPGSLTARILARLGPVVWDDPALAARVRVSRMALGLTAGCLVALGALHRDHVRAAVVRFFSAATHPVNLAIFRVVVFLQIWSIAWTDAVARAAGQPNALQVPPFTGVPPLGPLTAFVHWPVNPLTAVQVTVMVEAMKVTCITGMAGLFSRTSAALTAVLLFAGWGTMQWYGKVDHHHHLLWFVLILAVSRSGDAWSVDALIGRLRRGRQTDARPRGPDVAYGVPLQMCILLIGVLYFFPGFHKMWRSGFDWFLGPHPVYQLQHKWHMLGGWVPPVRIDRYPVLVGLGAAGTILFELSFIFLIFGRRTRYVAAALGVTFHTTLDFFGRFGFETLRNSYVAFFDWHRGISRIRSRLRGRSSAEIRSTEVPAPEPRAGRRPVAVLILGALLVTGNVSAGIFRMQEGWPVTAYPLFDGLTKPYYETLQIGVEQPDGSERMITPDDYRDVLGTHWNYELQSVLHEPSEERQSERLMAVWSYLAEQDATLAKGGTVRIYRVRTWTHPDPEGRPDEAPELILTIDP